MTAEAAETWARALRAVAALAVDPDGLKGMTVRARAGPVRQAMEHAIGQLPGPLRRIHPGLTDTQLFGGLNIAASLSHGHAVRDGGLAETPALLVLPMAERTPGGLAARLAQLLDAGGGHRLILLDESAADEPPAAICLAERLAFAVDLDGLRHADARAGLTAPADLDAARLALPGVAVRPDDAAALTALAARFGIDSLRAPLLALRAARALAALDGRDITNDDDLRQAAELVYPARATTMPQDDDAEAPEPPPEPPQQDQTEDAGGDGSGIPDEALVAAVAACVPQGLLSRLDGSGAVTRTGTGSGAGARRKGNRRGRPLPARPGRPDGRARIDVMATLRAAAPWQTIRHASRPDGPRLIVLPGDLRLRRYEDRSDRLLVFVVDASGSAAMARMAEAKGAVELLLAQAYSRRDQVAVIAFRGKGAELLLPPTRSLVQAKRRLAALPGGGGTPLAAGLREALALAARARGHGLSPALALLTDGRANVALDGAGGRPRATADALQLARLLAADRLPGLVIDTGMRQTPETAELAAALGAERFFLPHADAARISQAVDAALAG